VAEGSPRRHALVVDDDPVARTLYASYLRAADWTVDVCDGAAQALERLRTRPPDFMLTDIEMPELSGVDLLRAARNRGCDVPVVLITAGPSRDTAIEAVAEGAFRYLTKPVEQALLVETARQAADIGRLARLQRAAVALTAPAAEVAPPLSLGARFDSALQRLWLAWQPIMSVKARGVWAYEALVRSDEPMLASAPALLRAAEQLGRLHELGRTIRRHVAELAPRLASDVPLFVNVHARDFEDPDLYDPATAFSVISPRLVLEITERAPLEDVTDLRLRVQRLRSLGFRLAIDDLGAGYAGLVGLAVVEPDFVKLDRTLVDGVDRHPARQAVIRGVSTVCAELGMHVVAEGVERAEQRDVLADLGCELLQGYFFARPTPEFAKARW
jgi:EAL domain-containing protein (putative c-di-GMP-specific phosphodiesterase class I)